MVSLEHLFLFKCAATTGIYPYYHTLSLHDALPICRLKREAEAVMRHVEKHQPAIRALMHEYGVAPVTALLSVGIKKPRTIRHIIEVCRGNSGDGGPSYGGNKPPNFKVQQ